MIIWLIYLLICMIDMNRPPISTVVDKRVESYVFYHPTHETYDAFAEKYMLMPAWLRLLLLPVTAGCNFSSPYSGTRHHLSTTALQWPMPILVFPGIS